MTDFRINFMQGEVIQDNDLSFRFNFVELQVVEDTHITLQLNYTELTEVINQPLIFQLNYAELTEVINQPLFLQLNYAEIQVVETFEEPPTMSTELFPELPGLQWDIKRRPMFKTEVLEHLSGDETRYAFWQNPKWEFDMSYDYLPDNRSAGDSDLQKIQGFFLARQGRFDTFLYKFGQDYQVTFSLIGTGDGATAEYTFTRTYAGYTEELQYVEFTTPIPIIYFTGEESQVIASNEATFNGNIQEITSVDIGGTPLTQVVSAPGVNEYTVNTTTGVFGFNAAREGQTVDVNYRWTVDPADYTLTAPNKVIFDVSVPDTFTIHATFNFYYIVRFLEDAQELNAFMDKLWDLQELTLRSVVR